MAHCVRKELPLEADARLLAVSWTPVSQAKNIESHFIPAQNDLDVFETADRPYSSLPMLYSRSWSALPTTLKAI
eukprot:scaffold21788_cov31-Tisochrysis_lutea.AAC.2